MNISVNSLLNFWSDIYRYGHTLLSDCEYFIRIGFVDSSFMAAFIIENAQEHYMYILILCKVQGIVFFLPFAYVLSRRVYLSFRFK